MMHRAVNPPQVGSVVSVLRSNKPVLYLAIEHFLDGVATVEIRTPPFN